MNSMESITAILGWCIVLNFAFFASTAIGIMVAGKQLAQFHSKLFGLEASELPKVYFQYLGHYQTIIVAFNLMPYIALKLIT